MYITNVETKYGYECYSIDEDTLQFWYPEEYENGIKDKYEFFDMSCRYLMEQNDDVISTDYAKIDYYCNRKES